MSDEFIIAVEVHGDVSQDDLATVRDTVEEPLQELDMSGEIVVTGGQLTIDALPLDELADAVAARLEDTENSTGTDGDGKC